MKIIITGLTGMVGEGVLNVFLENSAVEEILLVNRRPCGFVHPKLTESIHTVPNNYNDKVREVRDIKNLAREVIHYKL